MTKGRATLPWRAVAEQKPFFITLGVPKARGTLGMTKERVVLHLGRGGRGWTEPTNSRGL
jgi:hypothetical protein